MCTLFFFFFFSIFQLFATHWCLVWSVRGLFGPRPFSFFKILPYIYMYIYRVIVHGLVCFFIFFCRGCRVPFDDQAILKEEEEAQKLEQERVEQEEAGVLLYSH